MFKINSYFTFQDILNFIQETEGEEIPTYPNQNQLSGTWFTDLFTAYDITLNESLVGLDSSFTWQDIVETFNIVMTFVYNRHAEDIIFQHEQLCFGMEEPSYTLTTNDIRKALSKLINVLDLTIPKYIPLLKQYKSASINPIASIKSTSKGKTSFNDTPQNIGDWGDEDHTSNISSSESETEVDVGSLMERLDSMKEYKSVILEWSNEFNQVFIKEEQLCL